MDNEKAMREIDWDALKEQEKKTGAAPQLIGGDYQFWYFFYCLLELKRREKIGFEIKEDVHVELNNGKCILYQLKHTVNESADGEKSNLTDLDEDLWKTFYNWVMLIKKSGSEKEYIEINTFILATNKSIAINSFPYLFTDNPDEIKIIENVKKLKEKCSEDSKIIKYIDSFLSLEKVILKKFIRKIKIEYGVINIIEKVKNSVRDSVHGSQHYLEVFYALYTLISENKYLDIANRKDFYFTYEEFHEKYRHCFLIGENKGKLPNPDRTMPLKYPECMEKQNFIKQLIDIDLVEADNIIRIKEHTTIMLNFINKFDHWMKMSLFLPVDVEDLDKVNKYVWKTRFDKIYRPLMRKIKSGTYLPDLEDEIKELACDVYDSILMEKIKISSYDELDQMLSNGYFYNLSDRLEIGWHYNWEERFK
ncbi:hypothetical protein [Acinetobacter sp.]|uniref:hypothetical protein n=1 Tax=Acinetobacter sp. TaxID=472 RepID=UPI002FD890B6